MTSAYGMGPYNRYSAETQRLKSAPAIPGSSRVRVQLGTHAGRTIRPERCASNPCNVTRSSTCQSALTRENQPLRLLDRGPGGVEVGGEERVLAPREEDVGIVGAAVGVEAVQGGRRRGEIARHDRAVRQPGAQPLRIRGTGPAECFPVGRPSGHRSR